MNDFPHHKQPFAVTPALLTSLEDCSEESVYAPGYIQPHGLLMTLRETDFTILQISENAETFLGIPATKLLGQPLQHWFSPDQISTIRSHVPQEQLIGYNPFELALSVEHAYPTQGKTAKTTRFLSTLYRIRDALVLELEPQLLTTNLQTALWYNRLQSTILTLRSADNLTDLANILAQEIKTITGFDRVMIYQFSDDDHGVVIAEKKEHYLESFLGLHYPATDIPIPARQLFLRNWVRHIPNVNSNPAYLLSDKQQEEHQLDLRDSVLRGISPYHVEYLQNMGVLGTLTISLIDAKRLWGLIACHHYSPKHIDYETRKVCEFLGQFASIELVHQQEQELNQYRLHVKAFQNLLQQAFLQTPHLIQQILMEHAHYLMDLVHADGLAIVLDRQTSLLGKTPTQEQVNNLIGWLTEHHPEENYHTQSLVQAYPPAEAFIDTANGLLTISIVLHQKSYHILWFRPEQIQTINWAGDLHTALYVDLDGIPHLTPRKSFSLWQETVRATSLPWTQAEIEAASMARNTLMLALLEFSHAVLEEAAEQAAIANRAKSQFLAKMSHELRTPLNAILGFTQLMHRNLNTPPEFQEHLGIISRSGEHLLTLINDVLEMSRIEAGQVTLTKTYFNLHRLLLSLQEMFALKASQKGLNLTVDMEDGLPRYICSDEAKLRQILINLMSNAIKFTTQGWVQVRVRQVVLPLEQHNPTASYTLALYFEVEDSGCGIDGAELESVFEAFIQTEQGRHIEGTGLGLAISRQFARLLGGDITAHSVANQGTTFTCWVMAQSAEASDLIEVDAVRLVMGLAPGQANYRILVVEDVAENRQLLKLLLEPMGFGIRMATNGSEAIAQWQQWQPHLILMDIQMPEMDGHEATRQIRHQKQSAQPIIIALTAYAFDGDRTASLQAGCDDYLAKPFTETALLETISRYLGVRYIYAEAEPVTPTPLRQKPLTKSDLKDMSPEWLAQVHAAACALNEAKIEHLITQIPNNNHILAKGLSTLINNFQLDEIAALTEL